MLSFFNACMFERGFFLKPQTFWYESEADQTEAISTALTQTILPICFGLALTPNPKEMKQHGENGVKCQGSLLTKQAVHHNKGL